MPIIDPASKRRIPDILMTYWEGLKAGRAFPAEDDLNPDDMEKEGFWKDAFLIHTSEIAKRQEYQFAYLGSAIQQAYGEDLTGIYARSFASPSAASLADIYFEVIATRKPVTDEGEFVNARNMVVRYRQCLVPLGKSGNKVDAILGAMRYRLYPGS